LVLAVRAVEVVLVDLVASQPLLLVEAVGMVDAVVMGLQGFL
jgi:hypothetical protein